MPTFPLALRSSLVLLFLPLWLGLGTACSWSVPADPGANARQRADPLLVTQAGALPGAGPTSLDPQAEALYSRRCAQCHELIAPNSLRESDWRMAVNKYGARAGLFGADRARVLQWLIAQAAP